MSLALAIWLGFSGPGLAFADADVSSNPTHVISEANADTAPVIITEILTGTKTSGSQEFIELYNTTGDPIDLSGWQVWYVSAQAANIDKPTTSGIIPLGDNATTSIIAAHGYYVLSGRSDYLPDLAQQFYSGTLAATGGNLRLLSPDSDNPCELDVQDQLAWGNGLYAQGMAAPAPATGQSVSRLRYQDGSYVDTYNNAGDFVVGMATPGQASMSVSPLPSEDLVSKPTPVIAPIADCIPPVPVDTSGEGSLQLPGASDAPPSVVVASPPPAVAASAAPTFPALDTNLVMPQLTELLPNPAPPATDAKDEFIELYNSNAVAFDLSGFMLKVGLATTHRYLFPAGTTLPPKSFTAFFSVQTGLSLSNSGGQVALLDPFGATLTETASYSTAKEGEVWALANGSWQWSTTPTPGSQNIVVQARATASRKSSASSSSKAVTAPKKLAPKPIKTAKQKTVVQTASPSSTSSPATVHPIVVAGVAAFALLYGLYEYRQDMANKLYQFRANRTARRAARTEIEGG